MNPRDLLSSELLVRWSDATDSLEVSHLDSQQFPMPLVQIRASTLAGMSFDQASSFIGETVVLLVPQLRDRFVDPATGERIDAPGA
jgi:hypothetical protein